MEDVPVREGRITLGQLLKLAGTVDRGSDVRPFLQAGGVTVNGLHEDRRGRKLVDGRRRRRARRRADAHHRRSARRPDGGTGSAGSMRTRVRMSRSVSSARCSRLARDRRRRLLRRRDVGEQRLAGVDQLPRCGHRHALTHEAVERLRSLARPSSAGAPGVVLPLGRRRAVRAILIASRHSTATADRALGALRVGIARVDLGVLGGDREVLLDRVGGADDGVHRLDLPLRHLPVLAEAHSWPAGLRVVERRISARLRRRVSADRRSSAFQPAVPRRSSLPCLASPGGRARRTSGRRCGGRCGTPSGGLDGLGVFADVAYGVARQIARRVRRGAGSPPRMPRRRCRPAAPPEACR